MNFLRIGLACFSTLLLATAQDHLVRETGALTPGDELAAFSVPEGFEIRLFASEPMINKPINLAVDGRGRVWVSSTVGYPYAAAKERWSDPQGTRVRDSRDGIKILEDTDGDGRADRVTDFADGLNIPTGVLPWHRPEHKDGCIAWSIPNLWYFADTDGDGMADHREVLFGPLGYEKDTHGMVSSLRLGLDGWVYATHGFNNTSHLKAKDGSELELHSGNVFRFRPDGSRVEIWSRGQVNPFGLAFDRRGNLYSADCHSAPVYQLIGGAVYPSFGKPHDGLGFGPTMIRHTHGSTGIAGIVFVDRGIWGPEWEDHVLIGNPVTSRVNLDRIHFAGTTPKAEEKPDFLVSEDPWFRPVDLAFAPDGALYIADFYNRIIGHYEVPLDHPGRDRERGRIWRIVRTAPGPPAGQSVSSTDPGDPLEGLRDDPWSRRAAAADLFESPSGDAILPLLLALKETPDEDTHLRHALRIALRGCLSLPGAFTHLGEGPKSEVASVAIAVPTAEAAAWLLGFPGSESLPPDFPDLRRRQIVRHGEPETLVELVRQEIASSSTRTLSEQARVVAEIAEVHEEKYGTLREPFLLSETGRLATAILDEMDREDPSPVWRSIPPGTGWEKQLRKREDGIDALVLSSLVRGSKGAEQYTGSLVSRPFLLPERLALRLCGHRGVPGKPAHEENFVRLVEQGSGAELARAYPPRRDQSILVEWKFSEAAGREVRLEVVDGDDGNAYAWIGLGEIDGATLPMVDFGADAERELLMRRFARLLFTSAPVELRDRLAGYLPPPPPAPPLEISPEQRERLSNLIADRVAAYDPAKADPGRGKTLFTVHCAVCHRIAGEGGLIGPQLDGIGSRGLARLAEDILDPNRNVDAHFRVNRLVKKDGAILGGFVSGDDGEVLRLLDATGQIHRVLRTEIASQETSAVSLMPAAFGEIFKPEEFNDLAGWLLSL